MQLAPRIAATSEILNVSVLWLAAIGNALAVLTDPEKRRRYDQYGTEADRVPRHSHGDYDYSRGFEGKTPG